MEYAIAELLDKGEIQRHIRRLRREYRVRRDTLVVALREHLGERLTFDVPAGGIALWVKAKKGLDVERWASNAKNEGAIVVTAASFVLDRRAQPLHATGLRVVERSRIAGGGAPTGGRLSPLSEALSAFKRRSRTYVRPG